MELYIDDMEPVKTVLEDIRDNDCATNWFFFPLFI